MEQSQPVWAVSSVITLSAAKPHRMHLIAQRLEEAADEIQTQYWKSL